MHATKRTVLTTLAGVCLVTLVGCFALPWSRTGNQGGSTPLSLLAKLASGKIGDLNPDDIQVLTDVVRDISQAPIDPVSDDLAAAVVDTLDANHVDTLQDLQTVGRNVEEDPNSLVIPQSAIESEDEVVHILQQLSDPQTQQAVQQHLQELGSQLGII